MRQAAAVKFRDGQEEFPVFALGLEKRSLRSHVDGFVFGLALAFDRANLDAESATGAVFRSGQEEFPVLVLGLAKRSLRGHVDGFVFGLALAFDRANLDAESATGAVFGRDLEGVSQILEF